MTTAVRSRVPPVAPVVVVLAAWAFLPAANLPSFDAVKLAIVLPVLAVATYAGARRRGPADGETSLRDPLLAIPLLVALAAAASALLHSPRGSLAGPALALACVAVARLVRPGAESVTSTLRAVSIAALGAGLYAIAQSAGLDPAPWGARREVVSTFGNTSFAAEFQAAALVPALVLALRPAATKLDRLLGGVGAATAAAHVVLARSRIDLVAAAAGITVLAVCVLRDRRRARTLAIAAGAAAVLVAALFVAAATGAIAFLGRSDTLAVRLHIWDATARLIADSPFRFGAAPFVDLYPPWRSPDEYRISLGRVVDTPHMDLLEIAATLGVVGVLAAIAWCVAVAKRLVALRGTLPWETAALAGTLAAIVVSGFASSPLTHPATALLAAVAAGHTAALAPRPASVLTSPRARWADVGLALALIAAFWPGPAFPGLRSGGFVALAIGERTAGDAQRAATLFDAGCASDPWSFTARYELGSLLRTLGQADTAVQALESAREIRPNDPDGRTNLIHALRAARRDADADRVLAESLVSFPWHPLLLAARAARASERGEFAAAVTDLDRAVAVRPFDLRLRAVRAEAVLGHDPGEASRTAALDLLTEIRASGNGNLMSEAARAFIRRDAAFGAVLTTRAARIAADRPDEACALAVCPVQGLFPPDPGYFDAASRVLRTCGHEEDATRLLGRALGLRAREALTAGDADRARSLAAKAADRDPIPEHRVTEALALARLGQRMSVREALSAALALGPVDAAAIRADPGFAALLPDEALETILTRAAQVR